MVKSRKMKKTIPNRLPPRPKLPRKCKNTRWYGTRIYEERERALACLKCGTVLPRRHTECKASTSKRSKLVKFLPKEKSSEVASPEDLECPICLNSCNYKRVLVLLCNHRFHKKCITQWFKEDIRCPLCRK